MKNHVRPVFAPDGYPFAEPVDPASPLATVTVSNLVVPAFVDRGVLPSSSPSSSPFYRPISRPSSRLASLPACPLFADLGAHPSFALSFGLSSDRASSLVSDLVSDPCVSVSPSAIVADVAAVIAIASASTFAIPISFSQPPSVYAFCLTLLSPLDANVRTQARRLSGNSGLGGRDDQSLVPQSTREGPPSRALQTHSTLLCRERTCTAELS